MSPVEDLIEAADTLARLTEGVRARRARAITKSKRRVAKIFRARFRAQRAALLKNTWLKKHLSEASAAPALIKKKLPASTAEIIGSEISGLALTGAQIDAFNGAVSDALSSGAKDVASQIGKTVADTMDSFISQYMRDQGFSKVASDIDQTTIKFVADEAGKAYETNGSYDDVVQSIKDSYWMSDARAESIAQTELNDAFSQGQLQFARETGAGGKSWDPDGEACQVCLGNVDDGVIGIDEEFSSGDDAPPAHTNCDCSLNIHAQSDDGGDQ